MLLAKFAAPQHLIFCYHLMVKYRYVCKAGRTAGLVIYGYLDHPVVGALTS